MLVHKIKHKHTLPRRKNVKRREGKLGGVQVRTKTTEFKVTCCGIVRI